MRKDIYMILFVGLLISNGAEAVTTFGNRSCGTWVKDREAKSVNEMTAEFWLVGYLSGLAMLSNKDFLANTDTTSIYLWMDNYCKTNPLETIIDAGFKLGIELMNRKDN